MNFNDPFVRALSQVILGLLALVLLIACSFSLAVVVDWNQTDGAGPGSASLVRLAQFLPKLSGNAVNEITNIVAIFVSAGPLAVMAVCFHSVGKASRLNAFGQGFTATLVLVVALSALAYLYLKPAEWGEGHSLGRDGLTNVQDWAKTALSAAAFYLATLLGIKVTK